MPKYTEENGIAFKRGDKMPDKYLLGVIVPLNKLF